ncbi:MAG: hypothetical protein HY744_34435 [Deltaproteobacteria bacterium]|nr:hypothetical protein [Deltaproteobacteria bacterium]
MPCRSRSCKRVEAEAIFDDACSGWHVFYERYPDSQGIMTLSRVGFDPAGKVALVYVSNQSHCVAGAGDVYHLARQADGSWTVVAGWRLWIS